MSAYFLQFFWLLVGHALADYPLQGDFLAKAKNAWAPLPGVPWQIAMAAHCLIHAGFVLWFTHNLALALLEFAIHYGIDVLKCAGKTSFATDQALHVACKLAWAIIP